MLGGDTLTELRTSFIMAEQERRGGVSSRMSPLVQVSDVGSLMSQVIVVTTALFCLLSASLPVYMSACFPTNHNAC